jgi:hypothetical protein
MHIPNELLIFGRTYDVRDVGPIQYSEGVLGLAAYRDGLIYLDENLDMALSLITLWHEAVHIAQQEILGTIDESQARWISLFVHTFLMQNPQILECYRNGLRHTTFDEDEDVHHSG